ncbi:ABC-2 transporter permease [Microbacterium terrisoli]|jgi:hypothetical protein|uniref:ABC-2 transporter permease n=1 Tax=Microbacterium terrisoli TaxID=3242192 RepID=UPI00280610BC|nr:ABC-2 transporter permease [Microbacterium protaetiae]
MIAFTRFDMRTVISAAPVRVLLFIIVVAMIGATIPFSGAAIVCGGYMSTIMLTYAFLIDERGNMNALYALSSVGRTAVVIGRYLTGVVFALVGSVIGLVVAFVLALVRRQTLDWSTIGFMVVITVVVTAIAIALQLPWFFLVGYTRGRPILFVLLIVFLAFALLANKTHLLDGIATWSNATAPAGLVVALIAGAVVLMVASAAFANRLFARRDL